MKGRIILILIISLAITFSCNKDKNDILFPKSENYRLIKTNIYNNSSDSIPGWFTELIYSEDGNLKRSSLYKYPDILETYREYDYQNNLLVEKRIFDGYTNNLKLSYYIKYTYQDNQLVKNELYWPDGTLKITEYFEYEGSNLVNTYKVNDSDGIYHQYKYTYNELNLLILKEEFMYHQELSSFTKYYYDNNSRLIKTEIFNYKKNIEKIIKYKYYRNKTVPIAEFDYDSKNELTSQKQFIYDDLDNLIETMAIDDQGINTLFLKKYNGELLIEYIRYDPYWGYTDAGMLRYEYEKIE